MKPSYRPRNKRRINTHGFRARMATRWGRRGALAPAEEGPEAAHRLAPVEARRLLTATARLPRAHRLARASDIRRCLTTGRRRRLEHLDMIWTDNLVGHPRMGLIVPKFQSSAVARNRLRRRLREIWRREIQPHQPASDLVIRARREAYGADFPSCTGSCSAGGSWRWGPGDPCRPCAPSRDASSPD